jgi:hypothetical protein
VAVLIGCPRAIGQIGKDAAKLLFISPHTFFAIAENLGRFFPFRDVLQGDDAFGSVRLAP